MRRRSERPLRFAAAGPGRAVDAWFAVGGENVAELLPPSAAGIPLGDGRVMTDDDDPAQDAPWEPLRLDLFGPRPRQVVLLGETDLARLIALRVAACGAAVAVAATAPARWNALASAVDGDVLTVLQPPSPELPATPPDQPCLLVMDGVRPGAFPLPQGRRSLLWVADLPTVDTLEPVLAKADALILGTGQSDIVTRGLELAGAAPRLSTSLSGLEPDEVLVSAPASGTRRARIRFTGVERELLNVVPPGSGAPGTPVPPLPSSPR